MKNKDLVPYELALRLKEIGFKVKSPYWYNPHGVLIQKSYECDEDTVSVHVNDIIEYWDSVIKDRIDVPTFSQAFRWFRENHNLNPSIMYNGIGQWDYTLEGNWSGRIWDTYEEAELACLERLIDRITNKKIFDFVTDL